MRAPEARDADHVGDVVFQDPRLVETDHELGPPDVGARMCLRWFVLKALKSPVLAALVP